MKSLFILLITLSAWFSSHAQDVVQAEYFIDEDAGPGLNSLVTLANPQPDGTYSFNVNLAGISTGYHKLFLRTKDSNGKWSLTAKRNIEVTNNGSIVYITGGEYFFDTDPGFGSGNAFNADLPLDSIITKTILATTNNLNPGYHKLYIRTKDSDGKWSLTAKRNVEITQSFVSLAAKAEYFFNTDPGIGNATQVVLTNPLPDGSFSFSIPFENIPDSVNTLYIRVRDSSNNKWSLTQWQKDSITTSLPASNLWSHVETWSTHKIPDANTIVILRNYVIVDINGICKSLSAIGPVIPQPTPPLILKMNPGKILKINSQ